MTEIIDLAMQRAEREDDNTKITVEQLLVMALKEVRSGELQGAERAFLCIAVKGKDGLETLEGFRCGLNRSEELGYIEAFKMQSYKHWSDT